MNEDEIEALNLDGWPLPDAYLIEIGRVGAMWSSLESILNVYLTKLFGFEEADTYKGFIITSHSSFPQRLDMLGSLCEQLVEQFPNLRPYKLVISSLRAAQTERNKIAHNGVHPGDTPGEFAMAIGTARGSIKTKVERVTLADIRRVSMMIDEAGTGLHNLIFKADLKPAWKRLNPSNK